MKKTILILLILSTTILGWCTTVEQQRDIDNKNAMALCSNNSWFILVSNPNYVPWIEYNCAPKQDYCMSKCAKMIDNAFEDLNDTRGNQWWYPDMISNTLNKCLDECTK